MMLKHKLQISVYFIHKIEDIFILYMCFFTFIQFISHLYKLHTPQGVHVTNMWSNLAFWYNEPPQKKTCCTLVLKQSPLNQSIFARYYISQLNQSSWKRHAFFSRIAATLQGTIWIVMKKLFQTKLYTFPKKELYLISNNNAFPNWSKHLEKGMYFLKDPNRILQHSKEYCVL